MAQAIQARSVRLRASIVVHREDVEEEQHGKEPEEPEVKALNHALRALSRAPASTEADHEPHEPAGQAETEIVEHEASG